MKSTFVVLLALAAFASVRPCGFLRQDGAPCLTPEPGTQYQLALSDQKQIKCEPESPTHDPAVFHMEYAKNDVRWNCADIKQSDSEFDAKFKYPPKPDSFLNLKGAHSYVHMESNEQIIINCFQSPDDLDENVFSSAKGFFPVADVKNGIKFLCINADKQQMSFADRVARAFSGTC